MIARRANWKKGFYIKFKAEKKSMLIIKKIVEELGSEFFVDMVGMPRRPYNNYDKWKDFWLPFQNKKFDMDIICGDRYIHMLVNRCSSYKSINKVLDKYSEFARIRYKKGFSPPKVD